MCTTIYTICTKSEGKLYFRNFYRSKVESNKWTRNIPM